MPVTYQSAPVVEAIAHRLIEAHHPHLRDVRIEYLWRSRHAQSKGRIVLGKARKVTGLNAYLSRPKDDEESDYFVIEIAADVWTALSSAQQEALVDHELAHCKVDEEEGALYLVGHDLEDFVAVVARHGAWRGEHVAMAQALQVPLHFEVDGSP